DFPWFCRALMYEMPVFAEVKSHVRRLEEIVCEVFLNDVALIPNAHDEFRQSVCGIVLEKVPQNRTSANLHHGLGPHLRLLAKPCAVTASQDHDSHSTTHRQAALHHSG